MSQQRYTIVIDDGIFSGASLHDGQLNAQPLDLSSLKELIPLINTAAITKLNSIEEEHATNTETLITQLNNTVINLTALEAFRSEMVTKVQDALASGDPEKFIELGVEFLTPEEEKIRAQKYQQLKALSQELGVVLPESENISSSKI